MQFSLFAVLLTATTALAAPRLANRQYPTSGLPFPSGLPTPTGPFPTGPYPTGPFPTGPFPSGPFPSGGLGQLPRDNAMEPRGAASHTGKPSGHHHHHTSGGPKPTGAPAGGI
ncbi:hypothetical protein M406DRAFT_73108 [Cryphonectria parasitica EP155]|uniref:Uncharacterized protein n=1 Tax=Cryphonectria parasitica (strain ATCC 38755 / EP155) TaxID=660469 RepID=A0A9P4XTE5_CRYP1|nr:uncharacterized protein M406DRAFT_73108 [Cryphonectria parasitica EP155]KAF3760634.1 hypothetical protein M406DRAFT_73108 [Cryphonectria parasitica EP155]